MHNKVRELTTEKKPSGLHSGLLYRDMNLISKSTVLINMWKTYTEQLFEDERTSEYRHDDNVSTPSILECKVVFKERQKNGSRQCTG